MLVKEIVDYIREHPSGKVKLAIADIDGVLRGKYVSAEKFIAGMDGESGFCDVVFGWDAGDVVYDHSKFTGWHTGYPDAPVKWDLATFRKIPWENDVPFFLGELAETGARSPSVCPRQLLKKVARELKDAGFSAVFSQEFEWFNFVETPKSAREKKFENLTPLSPGMFGYSLLRTSLNNPFFTDLFGFLREFGVPLEGLHTETGPGVFEAALNHADIVEAADRAILFKTAVKEIGYRHNILATFMAKIDASLPGCGGHVHQSIWDADGKRNLFHEEDDPGGMSELMKSYLAGQLHCLPDLLPLYAPNVNSYKRLVEGAWAPTTVTWGMDNRTVAIRVLCSGNKSARIETRVIGSDANPYLAMAAALASGLYGIRNNMKLTHPATSGNGYADKSHGVLPATLIEATERMAKSGMAAQLLGREFIDHFAGTREWEWRQHLKAVTDWEKMRYFEII